MLLRRPQCGHLLHGLFEGDLAAFDLIHDFLASREPPDAEQHHSGDADDVGDLRQHVPGQVWIRRVGHRRLEAELGERHGREVEHRGPTRLGDAIDVIHVQVGMIQDPVLRLVNQLVPVTELRGAGRAGRRTGGLLPLLDSSLEAHRALLDLRQRFVPLVPGNTEGAADHAVPAAHTTRGVVDHRSLGRLLQRAHGADRDARRVQAVHALAPHEQIVSPLDDGKRSDDRRSGRDCRGSSLTSLQAQTQASQPMQRVRSLRIAACMSGSTRAAHGAEIHQRSRALSLGSKELGDQLFPRLVVDVIGQVFHGQASVRR